MFNILDKFKSSFDKLSASEKEELKIIRLQTEKLILKNRFNEALDNLKSKFIEFQNVSGLIFIESIKSEIVKTYNEYIIYLINQPGKNSKNNQYIKKLFNECDYFISNNIKSYLLKQNNYACFLSQNGHSKQAVKLQTKLQKIDILNYLNNENSKINNKNESESELSTIAKDYSNLSSLNNNLNNHYDALISAMESLAITQFDKAFNYGENKNKTYLDNINRNLCFNYYSLGVQQECLKRNIDSMNSFSSAKLYIPKSGKSKNNNEYNFIKKIHIPKSDTNINFREGLY